jgi:hypothetical protein
MTESDDQIGVTKLFAAGLKSQPGMMPLATWNA